MKKVFKMFAAAIAIAFAAVACDPAQNEEIVPDEATYAIFTEAYNALTDQYSTNTAATILNTVYGDEKYAAVVEKYTPVFTAIEAKIKDLKTTADAFYADNVLADHIEELKAAILDLKVELAKAVVDFGAEITAIDEAYAAEQALIAANDAAYEQFAAEYESLQQEYTTVYMATIANSAYEAAAYEAVLDEYYEKINVINNHIAALATEAEASYEARTLATDLESIVAKFAGIRTELADFQAAFEAAISEVVLFSMEIEVNDITSNTAVVTFKPSDDTTYYLPSIETSWFEDYEGDLAALAQADLDYWSGRYGTSYAQYGYDSFEELFFDALACQGEYEWDMDGECDPETTYHAYAFAINPDYTVGSEVFSKDFTTEALSVKFYGTAVWHDVFVSSIFDMEGEVIDMPCDVYTDTSTPGVFYFDSPYNYANIASWFQSTPEEMKQYTGNWKRVMISIDCSNPASVVMPVQELGVSMSSSYGFTAGGMYYDYPTYDNYGTYADNTITFVGDGATKYVYWSMANYSKGAIKVSKLAEDFTVTITPGGQSVAPEFVKSNKVAKISTARFGAKNSNFKMIAR